MSNLQRWCCESAALNMSANLETQQWPQDWKRSVFIPIQKKGNAKECSNYHTVILISHASKVMLKILQARLQQYVNVQMFKLDLEKAKEQEFRLPTSTGSSKKQESCRKTCISASLTTLKPLRGLQNCGKFLRRWEYQTILPASWETCMQVKKQHLELDMEQQTGSKLGKEYAKAVYWNPVYPVYLTYVQRFHAKCWAEWSTSWNQNFQEKYQ